MLPNILLLLLVFGLTRWKKYPYAGALVFALVKGGLYFAAPLRELPLWACVLNGVIGFFAFGGLAAGMIYFLRRLDRGEPKEERYAVGSADRVTFQWEYIPLTLIVLVTVFAEMLITLASRAA